MYNSRLFLNDKHECTEYTAGVGWIINDINISFLTGQKNKRRRGNRNSGDEGTSQATESTDQRGATQDFQKRFQFNFDFSIRDDATYIHEFDSGRDAQATRGTYTLQISPAFEYDINKYFTMRLFMDYNQTKPKTLGGFDVTNINGGLTARFNLQ